MISHTVLIPEKNMGFVILCNAGVGLPGAMIYDVIDNLLGLESKDYAAQTFKRVKEYYKKQAFTDAKLDKEADHNKKSAFLLTDIEGTYSGYVYGSVTITITKKAEILMTFEHTPSYNTKLTHWEGNKFVFKMEAHPSLPRGWVTFYPTEDGKKVYEMKIDLPNPDFDFLEFDLIKK
jgi:hypothetical protein